MIKKYIEKEQKLQEYRKEYYKLATAEDRAKMIDEIGFNNIFDTGHIAILYPAVSLHGGLQTFTTTQSTGTGFFQYANDIPFLSVPYVLSFVINNNSGSGISGVGITSQQLANPTTGAASSIGAGWNDTLFFSFTTSSNVFASNLTVGNTGGSSTSIVTAAGATTPNIITIYELVNGTVNWIVTTPTGGTVTSYPTSYTTITVNWTAPLQRRVPIVVSQSTLQPTFTLVQTPASIIPAMSY